MSCSNPLRIVIKGTERLVPCGYCLNCRVDRRNLWSDRCNYELCQYGVGAFVTVTYDEYHLVPNLVKQYDGSVKATLNYEDCSKYIERIRHHIRYHNINNKYTRPDFKYLFVGEYGSDNEVFPRPHFHILFFGLDFDVNRKLFFDKWKNGFIDSLPILDGGINYVLKYCDKQLKGYDAFNAYDRFFISRPKMRCSTGLGRGLFMVDTDDIVKHSMTYACGRGRRRPIPDYYKRKYLIDTSKVSVGIEETIQIMKSHNLRNYSASSIASFKLRQAEIRERSLMAKCHNDLVPCVDYLSRYSASSPMSKELKLLCKKRQIARSLSSEYIRWQTYRMLGWTDTEYTSNMELEIQLRS